MSITLITGVPGSGKTLHCVADLLKPYEGTTVEKVHDNGTVESLPRTIYTNINGLLLDHEPIEGGGTWIKKGDEWIYDGNPLALRNWHNWAKAGAVICFDEFQKFWPPRPNGSAVPPDMQALDTHRHMGTDFIVITQNCNNVDRHLLGLVDRHLHVRRVANLPLAVIYEWDHASKTLNYKNSMTKKPWRFPKHAYKWYKSAEVHTKQKRKMPAMVWFILAGFAGAAYAFPTLKDRLTERISGKPPEAQTLQAETKGKVTTYEKDGFTYTVETGGAPVPLEAASAPAAVSSAPVEVTPPAPVIAGCMATPKACTCMDAQANPIDVPAGFCEAKTGQGRGPTINIGPDSPKTASIPPTSMDLRF